MRQALTATAAFASLLAALAVLSQSAGAIPLAKSPAAPQGVVDLAGRGGHGHGGGGGGPRFHGGGGGPRFHGGGPRFHGGHHHFHGGPRFYGPRFRGYPFIYGYGAYAPYYYDDYAGDDCRWLRRRALATGSRYWWNRYYACIED